MTVARGGWGDPGLSDGSSEGTDGAAWYDHLPPRPAPALDPMIDALERCIARYGVVRTSMTDIAREMGVARTTLYRQASSLEEAMALMTSRRFHRFLDVLVDVSGEGIDAELFIQVIVRTVRSVLADPVAQRILQDEPLLVGQYLTSGSLATLSGQIAELLTPIVRAAMDADVVRSTHAAMTAGWIVRIVFALCAVPPPEGELEDTVRFVLGPMLDPGAAAG
jgi:AcrR family transcriptional regulator